MSTTVQLDYGFARELAEAMRQHGLQATARPRKAGDAVATISFLCTNHDDHHPSGFISLTKKYIKIHCSVCTANKNEIERAEAERAIFFSLPQEIQNMIAAYVLFSDTAISNGTHNAFSDEASIKEKDDAWKAGDEIDTEKIFNVDETYYEDSLQYLSERLNLKKDFIESRLKQLRTARGESIVECERYALRFNFDTKACVKYRAASHVDKAFKFFYDKEKASAKDTNLWPSPLSLRSFATQNEDGTYNINTLIVTEGEIDALLLLMLNYTSVSVTKGANINEQVIEAFRHYIKVLSVKNIIILFDEDEQGRSAAKKLEHALRKEGVYVINITAQAMAGASVMYKYLHTLMTEKYSIAKKTKDITDYFSAFVRNINIYTKRYIGEMLFVLDKIIDSLNKRSESVLNYINLSKPAVKHTETEWIVESLLARGEYMLVSGHAKIGKSLFSMFLANRLVHGLDLFGHKACGSFRVAYLDAENSEAVKARRMYKNELNGAANFNFVYNSDGLGIFNLRDNDQVSELLTALVKEDIDVLIIDTLSSLIAGEDDNNKKYADIILNFVAKAKRLGLTVIAITHNNKYAEQDSVIAVKGTTNIAAQADTIFLCRKVKANDGFHYLLIDRSGRHEEEAAAHRYLLKLDAGKAVAYLDDDAFIALEIERLQSKDSVVSKEGKERKIEQAFIRCIDEKLLWTKAKKKIKDWLKDSENIKVSDSLIDDVFKRLKAESVVRDEWLDGKQYVWIENKLHVDENKEDSFTAYKEIEYKITAEADNEADLFDKYMAKYSEIEPHLLLDDNTPDGHDGGGGGDDGDDGDDGHDGGGDDGGGSDPGHDGGQQETGMVFANWLDVFEYLRKSRQNSIFEQECSTGLVAKVEEIDVLYQDASKVDVDELRGALFSDTRVALDLETSGEKTVLMALAFEAGKRILVIRNDDERRFAEIAKDVLLLSNIIGHNLSFDLKHIFMLLEKHGIQIDKLDLINIHDTMVFEKFINRQLTIKRVGDKVIEDEGSYALADLMAGYFGVAMEKSYRNEFSGIITRLHVLYNAMDALATLRIYERQKPQLQNDYVSNNIKKIFASVVYMAYASCRGFRFNEGAFLEYKKDVEDEVARRMAELNEAFESDERKESVIQLYLQKHKSLPAQEKRWRNADFVKAFFKAVAGVELEDASLDSTKLYRGIDTLTDLYIVFAEEDSKTKQLKTLEKHIEGGRIRGDFVVLGAITGRMRSKEPNLQNINKQNRRFMEADDENHCLVLYDFSNIEMRLAASIYNDDTLRRIFNEGGDAHKLLASRIYNKSEDEVTKEERQIAKMVNFASLYGTSPRTLLNILLAANPDWKDRISIEDTRKFLEAFFSTYTGVAKTHERGRRFVEENMTTPDRSFTVYIRLLNHVTYKVEGMEVDEYRKRRLTNQLLNVAIQGAAAAGLYETLHRFHRKLYDAGYNVSDAYVVACVHDEIVVHVRKEIADKVAKLLVQAADEAFTQTIDVQVGKALLHNVKMAGELRISRNFRGGEEDKV